MKIATYNLMHGLHGDMLMQNIKLLINQGTEVICLQEYEAPFTEMLQRYLKDLPDRWEIEEVHTSLGGNLAIAWNTFTFTLQEARTILLPTLPRPALSQALRKRPRTIQRAALSCTFSTRGKTVCITTLHLAWEGGIAHRLRQLRYLRREFLEDTTDAHIICGDFNTIPPVWWQRWQQRKMGDTLGPEYVHVLPDLPWTYDNAYFAPQDGLEKVTRLCRWAGITFRSRLDYFFVRDLKLVSGEMLDLPGSDHRPLLAEFR